MQAHEAIIYLCNMFSTKYCIPTPEYLNLLAGLVPVQMLPCFDFLVASLQQLLQKADNGLWKPEAALTETYTAPGYDRLPQRRASVNFTQYSWVLEHPLTCYPNAPCYYRQGDRACPGDEAWLAGSALVPGKEPSQFDPTKPRLQVTKPPVAAQLNAKEPVSTPVAVIQEPTIKREAHATSPAEDVDVGSVGNALPEAPPSQLQQPEEQQGPTQGGSKGQQQPPLQEKQQQPSPSSARVSVPVEDANKVGKIKIIGARDDQSDEDRKVGILSQIVPWALLICVFGVVAVGFLWRGRANGNVKYSRLGLPRSRPPTPIPE
jgi:hypothetical protein